MCIYIYIYIFHHARFSERSQVFGNFTPETVRRCMIGRHWSPEPPFWTLSGSNTR